MTQGIDYNAIRQRVEKRMKQRKEWLEHLGSYVVVNLLLWSIWLFTGAGFPWPVFVTLAWGIGMGIHTLTYITDASMERAKEDAIEREIRREKMRLYGDPDYDDSLIEKPKRRAKERERAVRLTDDGELSYEDEAAEQQPSARQKGN
jgi:hypothetical protein